ncbi:MAG: ABC transporter permease [Dokdonella sp.]|uniref:ABC transporter permease n=1 Tax=Dokdonella sp. TaxID=2291710 RepID=UPI0025BF2B30|nr:ABC transporter permease [Dokdonella sp.]MBX3700486.1 ABC transporter permease [Dokdonella sp.]MCW5579510.1 ABC transporter permease [Dokdonella sp.]
MNSILIVFLKEVRENLRDRRTVLNTLVTGPLMAPLIFVLLINTLVTRELSKAEAPLPLPVVGAQYAPNLIAALKQGNVDIKDAPADPERAVREMDADVVLRIGEDFASAWRKGESAQLELIYDASRQDAQSQVARLRGLLDGYGQRTGALRLLARGLSPNIMRPIAVAKRDQSTAQSRSGSLFAMLPYFFILGGFIGGMALAIDTTAGERERQSLEPLLANPAPRWKILTGKLAATTVFAITTVLLSILAFAAVGQFLPTEKIGMSLSLGPYFIAATLFVMLPLAALLGVLQTLVAAFAKSYREAQTYLSLLMIVPVIPTMLMSIVPIKTQTWMYAVPLMGQQVSMLRLLRGDPVADSSLVLCFATTTLAVMLAGVVTARIYQSERLAISA